MYNCRKAVETRIISSLNNSSRLSNRERSNVHVASLVVANQMGYRGREANLSVDCPDCQHIAQPISMRSVSTLTP